MKLTAMICPACGAKLEAEEGRKTIFCSFCGVKVDIDHENEHVIRYVDEAKIRELEMEEKKRQAKIAADNRKKQEEATRQKVLKERLLFVSFAGLAIIALGIILIFVGIRAGSLGTLFAGILLIVFGSVTRSKLVKHYNEELLYHEGMVRYPPCSNDAIAHEVENLLKSSGFRNIQMFNMKDVRLGLFVSIGEVESVTINGVEPEVGAWYDPMSAIIIRYHGSASDN